MDHYDLYCFHYFLKECSIKFSKLVSIGGGGGGEDIHAWHVPCKSASGPIFWIGLSLKVLYKKKIIFVVNRLAACSLALLTSFISIQNWLNN